MSKKFVLYIGIIFCLCLFTGCATAENVSIVYADSSRMLSYTIKLDKQKLGANYDAVLGVLNEAAPDYWLQLGNYYDITKANFKSSVNKETSFYEIKVTFKNYEEYCKFHHTTPEEQNSGSPKLEEGVFFTKRILLDSASSVKGVFLNILDKPYILNGEKQSYSVLYKYATDFANSLGKTREEAEQMFYAMSFSVTFAFPSAAKISSNAKNVSTIITQAGLENDELTYYTAHTWELNYTSEPDIVIYSRGLTKNNVYAWYGLALLATLIFGIVLYFVFYFQQRAEKNKKAYAIPTVEKGDDYDRTKDYDLPKSEENSSQNDEKSEKIPENKQSISSDKKDESK